MSVSQQDKTQLIQDFARHPGDSGSVEVQVALLTERIGNLTEHLRRHSKDLSTRRGLLRLVAQRSSLLKYLKGSDSERYVALVQRLGLRG